MGILVRDLNKHRRVISSTIQPSCGPTFSGLDQEPVSLPLLGNCWGIKENEEQKGRFELWGSFLPVENRNVFYFGPLALAREIRSLNGFVSLGLYNQRFCEGIKIISTSSLVREIIFMQPLFNVKSICIYQNKIVVYLSDLLVIFDIGSHGRLAFPRRWIHFGKVRSQEQNCFSFLGNTPIPISDISTVVHCDPVDHWILSVTLLRFTSTNSDSEFESESESDRESETESEYLNGTRTGTGSRSEPETKWDFDINLSTELTQIPNSEIKSNILMNLLCLYNNCEIWFYPFEYLGFNSEIELINKMESISRESLTYRNHFNLQRFLRRDELIEKISDMTHLHSEMYLIKTNKKLFSIKLPCSRGSEFSDYNMILDGFTPQTQIATSFNGEIILILRQHIYHCSLIIFQWHSRAKTWIMSGCNEVNNVSNSDDNKLTLYGNDHHNNRQTDTTRLGYILVQQETEGRYADYQMLDILAQSH